MTFASSLEPCNNPSVSWHIHWWDVSLEYYMASMLGEAQTS